MVRDPSIVSPSLTGVFIGGGHNKHGTGSRGARCRGSVVPPLLDGDGGVTDRATRGACSAGSGLGWRTASLGLRPPLASRHRLGFVWDRTLAFTRVSGNPEGNQRVPSTWSFRKFPGKPEGVWCSILATPSFPESESWFGARSEAKPRKAANYRVFSRHMTCIPGVFQDYPQNTRYFAD